MNQTPGRVFKGKKMCGHLGAVKTTVQNLQIHSIDVERSLILVKGAVPGAKGGDVLITPAVKLLNKG
jgi:large subunit ribosomal protein L3